MPSICLNIYGRKDGNEKREEKRAGARGEGRHGDGDRVRDYLASKEQTLHSLLLFT
jgi:hypothetical protein